MATTHAPDRLRPGAKSASALELSVVVPIDNETRHLDVLVTRLSTALRARAVEILFVEPSDDNASACITATTGTGSAPVRIVRREPAGGVDHAAGRVDHAAGRVDDVGVMDAGFNAANGEYICFMGADLRHHPPEVVAALLGRALEADRPDVVVASRAGDKRTSGLRTGALAGGHAGRSRSASMFAKVAFPRALRGVSDPTSGFFLVWKEAVNSERLPLESFRVLMDVAVRHPGLRIAEVPFRCEAPDLGYGRAGLVERARSAQRVVALRGTAGRSPTPRSRYDIHGIVSVESDAVLPELEKFRVQRLDGAATIRVHVGEVPPKPHVFSRNAHDLRYFHYRELLGKHGFAAEISMVEDRVVVTASTALKHSPHVLYTNLVEPLLRWTFVQHGFALVHAAVAVSGASQAFLITARTDTGKTTTMLKLLDAQPYGFMADDFCILSPDGIIRSYPKPLTISQHTLHAVNSPLLNRMERLTLPLQSRLHSREGRRMAFLMAKSRLPVATINQYVQLMVPPPKFHVERLVPDVRHVDVARVAGMFIIQRGDRALTFLEPEEALDILLENCEDAYGFPPYHQVEDFVLHGAGDLRSREREIIDSALTSKPAALLSSPDLDWASRIPILIERFRRNERLLDLVGEELAESRRAGNGRAHRDVTLRAEESNGSDTHQV